MIARNNLAIEKASAIAAFKIQRMLEKAASIEGICDVEPRQLACNRAKKGAASGSGSINALPPLSWTRDARPAAH